MCAHRHAVDDERAGVGPLGAGDDLDQGRFAGAVLADERVDLAGAEVERHALERAEAGEGLANGASVEK